MKCEICHEGPPNGPAIHRVNEIGEMPARWRCEKHLTVEQKEALDPEVRELVSIIENRTLPLD
jgi:hypothetical protein